jgi:hypothetical protein
LFVGVARLALLLTERVGLVVGAYDTVLVRDTLGDLIDLLVRPGLDAASLHDE